MTPATLDAPPVDDPHAWALRYAAAGYRVLPIKPGGKHPPMASWQHAATTDPAKVDAWWRGLYRGHGVGMAMGQGVFALDVDVSDGKPGAETLADLEARYGALPATVEQITGSGGRHLLFACADEVRNNASTKLGPGLDIRGDGGQIVVAPTVHPNGTPYAWREGRAPWEIDVAEAPRWLVDLLAPPVVPAPAVGPSRGPSVDSGDSIAEWVNQRYDWTATLTADGWTPGRPTGDQQPWTRPGKKATDGASAVLHLPDGPFVVFTTSVAELQQPWASTSGHEGWAYSMFGYIAATRHRGDRSQAARMARSERTSEDAPSYSSVTLGPSTATQAPVVPAAPVVMPVDAAEWEDVASWGGDALAHYGDAPSARWGKGDRLLWARGESLIIAGRTGVGKTTLTLSVLAGLVGIESSCLGLPIEPAERVLYLAMDRPRQIIRAMTRRFGADCHAVLNERLVVRRGPLPSDVSKVPDIFLIMARRYGCDVVIVDSLKDAAVKLTDDEVGGQINRAVQYLNQHEIDALVLHHNRKGDVTQRQGDDYEPTVEDVYGSNWITSGAGSVIILHGQPGAELVKMHHVKQPSEPLGPWQLEHDHVTGRTTVVQSFDMLAWLRSRGEEGGTALEAARAEHKDTPHEKIKSSGKEAARARRRLDGMVKDGLAERVVHLLRDGNGQQKAERWRALMPDSVIAPRAVTPVDNYGKSRDGGRDGGFPESRDASRDESVTHPQNGVTKNTFPQVTPVDTPVTHPDPAIAVTLTGGLYNPPSRGTGPTVSEILTDPDPIDPTWSPFA